jgi:Zn-dependent M28 family amino/carboxypeptidase
MARDSRVSVSVLAFALGAQLLVGGAFIWAAATDFSFLGHTRATSAAANPVVDRFDERHAFAELRREVAFGPRPAGSAALRRLAGTLRRRLPHGRFEPLGGSGLRNIVGALPGTLPAVVIGAHYDTKDIPGTARGGGNGFLGANDGAGGTAAVLELARALRGVARPAHAPQLRFVLFDGEESPPGAPDFYSAGDRGSKAYVAAHRSELRAMVLVDFIAQRGLRIPREAGSDAALWAKLRAAAKRVGAATAFPDATRSEIEDDHTPFARAGIPAIDLIDFDYSCFHRACDTVAQLSPQSIDAAGETLVALFQSGV